MYLQRENEHHNATTVDSNVIFASNHWQTLAELYFHTETPQQKIQKKISLINIFFLTVNSERRHRNVGRI